MPIRPAHGPLDGQIVLTCGHHRVTNGIDNPSDTHRRDG